MVAKVAETKTVADSLWQGYNVSLSLSYFSETEKKELLFSLWQEFSMNTSLRCHRFSSFTVKWNQSWDTKHRYTNDDMLNFLLTRKTNKYIFNINNVVCSTQTSSLPMLNGWRKRRPWLTGGLPSFLQSNFLLTKINMLLKHDLSSFVQYNYA